MFSLFEFWLLDEMKSIHGLFGLESFEFGIHIGLLESEVNMDIFELKVLLGGLFYSSMIKPGNLQFSSSVTMQDHYVLRAMEIKDQT